MIRKTTLPLLLALAAAPAAWGADAAALWSGKVQPLLDVQCVKCHGVFEQKSGLELDTPESVMKGGDDGVVVVPGKPEESLLYKHLAAGADPHMPPKKQLTDAEREVIREWIAAMAVVPVPPVAKPQAPRQFDSITQAIDVLISESWERRGVKPAPAVDDGVWCRRVYLEFVDRTQFFQTFVNDRLGAFGSAFG